MVAWTGLADPVAPPLHELNEYPEAGLAVRVTTVPDAYLPSVPGAGLAKIEPPPEGLEVSDSE